MLVLILCCQNNFLCDISTILSLDPCAFCLQCFLGPSFFWLNILQFLTKVALWEGSRKCGKLPAISLWCILKERILTISGGVQVERYIPQVFGLLVQRFLREEVCHYQIPLIGWGSLWVWVWTLRSLLSFVLSQCFFIFASCVVGFSPFPRPFLEYIILFPLNRKKE